MRIAIIGTAKQELNNLKDQMTNRGVKSIMGFCYYIGDIKGTHVVLVQCDIGKVNMAICTSLLFANFEIDAMFTLGAATPICQTLHYGDIAISTSTAEWDIDNSVLGYDRGYVIGINKVILTCNEQLSHHLFSIAQQTCEHVEKGLIISGDQYIGNEKDKEMLRQAFNPIAVDSGSASINHVCEYARIPFCSVKVIYGKNTLEDYEEFTNIASKKLMKIMNQFFDSISNKKSE